MIYLPHTDCQLAYHLAERMRSSVNSNEGMGEESNVSLSITISVGVLSIEDFDDQHIPDNPEGYLIQLFGAVDKALYKAKQNGRIRIDFAAIK